VSDVPPEVVARAQAGDPEAFRVLFDAHLAPVRRFCRDLLRDQSAADEAAQETFVRAHGRLHSLREGERLLSWLLGIARLVSLEQLRRARRDGPQPLFAHDGGPGAGSYGDEVVREPHGARAADPAGDPEAALLGAEADRVLAQAIAGLSEERRSALLLRLDHGLGYPEIALAMGWSLQKVKNEIHRARLQLRAQLGDYLEGAA
jgi:RNA polymerase sigma-70 factor, ECF subfamily